MDTTIDYTSNNTVDSSVGIIIAIVIAFIVLLIVIVVLTSNKNDSKVIVRTVGNKIPQPRISAKPVSVSVPAPAQAPKIQPNKPKAPDLINNIMNTRRFRNAGAPIPPNFLATQILNTLQFVNQTRELADRRLPIVIDLAVAIPDDPYMDRKLQEILVESANQTRDKIIGNRRAIARAEPTPAARMDKYIELSTTHTNDDQNSHDTYVNKCLRDIMAILREDQKDTKLPTMFHIRCTFKQKYNILESSDTKLDTKKENSILTVIDMMDNNGASRYNSSIEATEAEVLQRVFERAHHPKNKDVKDNIIDAMYQNFGSCFEGGNIVCSNGRCAKVISSLTKLDFDERTHVLHTLEYHRNNIYNKIREMVKDRSNKALTSDNPKVRDVAKSFLAEKLEDIPKEIDEEKNKEFTLYLRKEAARLVNEMSIDLPKKIIDHITNEVIASIG